MVRWNSFKNVAIFQQQMFWLHPRYVCTVPPQSASLREANCENRCLNWCEETTIATKCNWGVHVFTKTVTFSNLPALQPGPVSLLEPSEKLTLWLQNTGSLATCSGVMKSTNLSWRRVFTVASLLLPWANQQDLFSFPLLKHKQEVGPLVTCFVQRFYCLP